MSRSNPSFLETESQEPFAFLKTVVGDDTNNARNDSDKENDNVGLTSTTEYFRTSYTKDTSDNTNMSKEENDVWEDFYNEDEFETLSNDKKSDEISTAEFRIDRVLEKVEEEGEDDYVDESNATDTLDSTSHTKDNHSDHNSEKDRDTEKSTKRKRRKKLFKRIRPPSSPSSRTQQLGGSHPNLSQHNSGSYQSDNHSINLETMSDTSGTERKLSRRKQVSRPRCAGPAPGTSGERLQQKYQELEQLMVKPLANPGVYVRQTRNQLIRLQGLSSHSHHSQGLDSSSLPPTGQQSAPRAQGNITVITQAIGEDSDQVYSTIRTVQASNTVKKNIQRPNSAHPQRRPLSGQKQNRPRPQSAGHTRPVIDDRSEHRKVLNNVDVNSHSTINSRGRRRTGGKGNRNTRSDSSASGGSQKQSDRSLSRSKDGDYDSISEDESRSRSESRSPGRAIQATDNHIKNSSNPALIQWLKVKNREFRRNKLEERKKKRKERAEKQEEELKKQELLEKAEEKVKEWMTKKRKEAWKQAKEEQKRQREEEKKLAEHQASNGTETVNGRKFIPVRRPLGKYEKDENTSSTQQQNPLITTPQPPKSKFVYKRPVSGRVRLMKLQQVQKEDTKKQEAQKKEMEKLLEEEKAKKMRVSYDQWLLKKREEDYARRQELAKQRALAKSDPELDRIVPEMARRRIENIKRGKKRIQSGNSSIDDSVNKSFGGGDFNKDDTNKAPSYKLEVSGDKKSLKPRPNSAKPSPSEASLNPKQSRSPRRPQSANPRVKALMEDSQDTNPDNAFKLPFPPDLGVPKHVAAKQEKLFSQEVIASASLDGGSLIASILAEADENKPVSKITSEAPSCSEKAISSPDIKDMENLNEVAEEDDEEKSSFFVTDGNINEEADGNGTLKLKEEQNLNLNNHVLDNNESVNVSTSQKDSNREIESPENKEDEINGFDTDKKEKDDENVALQSAVNKNEDENVDDGNIVPPLVFEEDEEADIREENMDLDNSISDANSYTNDNNVPEPGVSNSIDVKHSTKKVSFSDRATIHEDPLAGISNDAEFFDDYNQIPDNVEDNESQDLPPPEDSNNGEPDYGYDDDYDDDLDPIETHYDDEDEAEDERGGYLDSGTPRDNDF